MLDNFAIIGFGPTGWGALLLRATGVTVAMSITAFAVGLLIGTCGSAARLSNSKVARTIGTSYVSVVRGLPDLLLIYLFYFGSGAFAGAVAGALGFSSRFVNINPFVTGALAVGVTSGAYQTEVLRGAFLVMSKGELEAAQVLGMSRLLMLRRIVAPQVVRTALPGLGNVWQTILKESALVSVTGLVEIVRQVNIGANSTNLPFTFFVTGALIFLVLTAISGEAFRRGERYFARRKRVT
jgi:octopine/nopaline transport system permease protein